MKTLEEREQAVERERKIYEESDKRRNSEREGQRRRVMTPTEEENRNPAYRRAMEYERSALMRDEALGLNRPVHTTVRDFRELSESEKQELAEWRKSGKLPTQPKGREPFTMGGGYLRYRRVYYGSDTNIVMKGRRERPSLTERIFRAIAA